MKKMISILFIILLVPFLAFSQETAPAEKEKPKEETAEPESFFNDLISSLNTNTEEKKEVPANKEELPVPDQAPPLMEEKAEPADPDKIETDKAEIPVPDQSVPNQGVDLNTQDNALPVDPLEKDLPVDPLEKNTDVPSPVQQIAPDNVPTQDIVIGGKDNKKQKKQRVKKEREPRDIVPFIEPPEPRSSAQKKYVKGMEKRSKSRMRLITLDPADHVFSRKFRSPLQALQNPANLGVRAELTNSFSIIPINTFDLDLKTSTRPFVFYDEFLSTGELLTPAREDSMVAMLGPNGLELPLDINMPTVMNLKMGLLGGSIFVNAGLFVQERSRIPGEFFGIILDGATFDNPFQMTEELGVNVNAYAKGSAGYGTFVELPGVFGELRFGATANAYAGAFANVNVTNLELVPSMEGISVQGTLRATGPLDTLSLFGPEGFAFSLVDDYMEIPNFTMGFDFGLAWRFKLNRVLPIAPKFLKNYFDFQIGVEDLGASISMNHAYVREISFGMETDDLLTTFSDGFSLDSMMVLDETVLVSDSTISMPLGTKLNMSLNYQPIPQLMLKGGITSFLSEGLNSNSGPNYFYGVEIYPISSLCLHGSVTQKGQYRFSEAGIKLYSQGSEFGLKVRVYDLDFSFTENVSGAGLMFNWAKYF
jgi:hypothetical protein